MTTDLKVGDVVWLKSGGPAMTVENIDSDGKTTVVWFIDTGELKRAASSINQKLLTTTAPLKRKGA